MGWQVAERTVDDVMHATPQPLQLLGSLVRFFSQPFDARPSQFPKPAVQAMLQVPDAQEGVPPVVLHALPQPPQWLVLTSVLVSQPLP